MLLRIVLSFSFIVMVFPSPAQSSWLIRSPQNFSALLELNRQLKSDIKNESAYSVSDLWLKTANEISTDFTIPNFPIKTSVSYQLKDSLRRAALYRSNLLPNIAAFATSPNPTNNEPQVVRQLFKSPISIAVIDFGADKENANVIFKWDFVDNDSMPFEESVPATTALLKGGNPGVGNEIVRVIQETGAELKETFPVSIYRVFNSNGAGKLSDFLQAVSRALENRDRVLVSSMDLNNLCHQFTETLAPFEQLLNDLSSSLEKNQAYLLLPTGLADEKNEHSLDESCLGDTKFAFQHRIILVAATENDLISENSKYGNRTTLLAASGERSVLSESSESLVYSQINWNHSIFAASRTAVALTQRLSTSLTIDAGLPLQILAPFLLPSANLESKISSSRILNIGNKPEYK